MYVSFCETKKTMNSKNKRNRSKLIRTVIAGPKDIYVRCLHAHYTGPALYLNSYLIGKKVLVELNKKDSRSCTFFDLNGSKIGNGHILGKWSRTFHDVEQICDLATLVRFEHRAIRSLAVHFEVLELRVSDYKIKYRNSSLNKIPKKRTPSCLHQRGIE